MTDDAKRPDPRRRRLFFGLHLLTWLMVRLMVGALAQNVNNMRCERYIAEQMLAEQPQLQLLTAMRGSLGLEMARQHRPDLILLDLHLPDLRGNEVLEHLRNDALTRHIPVVIVSADATARQIQRLKAAGAQNYLTKPLDISELFRVIDESLRDQDREWEPAVA